MGYDLDGDAIVTSALLVDVDEQMKRERESRLQVDASSLSYMNLGHVDTLWMWAMLPALRSRSLEDGVTISDYTDACHFGRDLLTDLFYALHARAASLLTTSTVNSFWHHQRPDPFDVANKEREVFVDKEALTNCASRYLWNRRLQNNRVDWIFLDSMVFMETEALAHHLISTRYGVGKDFAFMFQDRNPLKYIILRFILTMLNIVYEFIALPGLALYLYLHDHPWIGAIVGGLFCLSMLSFVLVTLPYLLVGGRKQKKKLELLIELYSHLGGETISPRKLREQLDQASSAGVQFDAAVFSIVDRMVKRDPTAFIPR